MGWWWFALVVAVCVGSEEERSEHRMHEPCTAPRSTAAAHQQPPPTSCNKPTHPCTHAPAHPCTRAIMHPLFSLWFRSLNRPQLLLQSPQQNPCVIIAKDPITCCSGCAAGVFLPWAYAMISEPFWGALCLFCDYYHVLLGLFWAYRRFFWATSGVPCLSNGFLCFWNGSVDVLRSSSGCALGLFCATSGLVGLLPRV